MVILGPDTHGLLEPSSADSEVVDLTRKARKFAVNAPTAVRTTLASRGRRDVPLCLHSL